MSSWYEVPATGARVIRLHRIRVLVLSRDQRYSRLALFLLRRKGFLVEAAPLVPEEAVSLVERHRPDVVVLDGNGSLAEVAPSLAGIEALCPSVPVLVVVEDAQPAASRRFRPLPKWDAADRLADEIERAYFRLTSAHEPAPDAS
jgi:chemotaxis response regulator CheB